MIIKTLIFMLTSLAISKARFKPKKEVLKYLPDLEVLVDTEKQVIDDLKFYVSREEARLLLLEEWVKRLKKEYVKASRDVTYYLGNPINAFTLIKRLSVDLDVVENAIRGETEFKRNPQTIYPTDADLVDAMWSLELLRDKYGLEVSQLSNGILQSNCSQTREMYTEVITPMSPSHVYLIGQTFLSNDDFPLAMPWLHEAFRRMEHEGCKNCQYNIHDVLKDILRGYLKMKDYENYVIWDEKRVALDPNNVEDVEKRTALRRAFQEQMDNVPQGAKQRYAESEKKEYFNKLCRGDIKTRSSPSHVCYYSRPHPALVMTPVKAEVLHQSPLVMMFHGVLTEQQTDELRMKARPKLKDLPVIQSSPFHAPITMLEDSASPILSNLSKKVSYITGYVVDSAEPWKIINYGVGKMCPLHEDKPGQPKKDGGKYKKSLQKMGTIVVYLSNVTVGGAMVFPALRLTVFPEQGSVLFWLNQLPSGQHDRAVVHMECAAVRGQKWYAVKWPFQYMQKQCPIWKTDNGTVTEQTYFKVVEKHRNLWKRLTYKGHKIELNEMLKKPDLGARHHIGYL